MFSQIEKKGSIFEAAGVNYTIQRQFVTNRENANAPNHHSFFCKLLAKYKDKC